MAKAAVSSLLDNLNQVLEYNRHLVPDDVRKRMLNLQRELETLKGLLKDFLKINLESQYLKETLKKIMPLLDLAQDAVDAYQIQAAVEKSRSRVSKAFHVMANYPRVLRDAAKQIEAVTDEVRKINVERVQSQFEVLRLQYQPTVNDLNQAGSSSKVYKEISKTNTEAPKVNEDENVIGFDKAAKDVEVLLTAGAQHLEVISIVGMLGIGKTTLARKVYKSPNVDYEYMIRAFVYVSHEYEKKEVYLQILSSFSQISDEVNQMTEEMLEKYLHQQLEGRQYLVVLDDVWEKEDWARLKDAFPNNRKRCRVLITTRNQRVAKHANTNNPYSFYELDFLTANVSRDLLHWSVFRQNSCPMELQQFEMQIAQRCNGLPLAIVVIAGIILQHPDRTEWWRHVASSVGHYILKETTQTANAVQLMYRHLPDQLKPCFLYFGAFCEEFDIPVWKLLRLWIAEGLIPQEGDLNLEDMAEIYLEELVYRSLVMIGQLKSNGGIKTCRIHGALGEFCKNQAIQENLFKEIDMHLLKFFLSGHQSVDQYRGIRINNANVVEYISSAPSASGKLVRSFLTFPEKEVTADKKFVFTIPKNFKLLRVLEIQSLHLNRFPHDICNLVLLRYLAISSKFWSLPPAISTLWNLQTLIVNTTSHKVEIKVDIWKMPQFRHLHTNRPVILPCPDAQNSEEEASICKNVQTLCNISPENCRNEVFVRTPKLKKLGIRGTLTKLFEVSGESSLFDNLRRLDCLENLKLLNDHSTSRLESLPSKRSFPKRLTKLTLFNTFLGWKEMSTLGQLENLEALKLKEYAFQGKHWQTERGGFHHLKHLHIGRTDLEVWEASADHFPRLKRLELYDCDKLRVVPHDGLADIPSLQSLVLHCTNHWVVSSAKRLHVLKLQREQTSRNSFRLFVYPPDI